MPHPDKGKIFLKVAARVLLAGMHEVPIVGAVLRVSRECWEALRDVQEQATADERVGQLEQAAALSPDEAQQAAAEVIAEVRAQGQAIDPTRAEAVKNIMAAMPAQIRERTYATLNHARRVGTVASTVLPVTSTFATAEREAFYTSLFPQRMPLYKTGDKLPHGNPEWQLERLLGVGSFGEVWLARRDPVPNQASVYAVKFCQDAASVVILKDEAKNLKKLQGQLPVGTPHIVALLELQLQAMPYWLAFEYIDGGTLESRMRLGPMDWPTTSAIFRPLVEGMAKVHELGVIHRDLKPANILLADGKYPRIADFGIGKVVALQAAAVKQATGTHTTRGYGTLGYMSPEQQAGVMDAHPADDVYALGVLLWQMLVGQMKTLDFADDIDDLGVPDTVKAVIRDCVFKPRAKRIQDALALLRRLEQQSISPQPPPISVVKPTPTQTQTQISTPAPSINKPSQAKTAWGIYVGAMVFLVAMIVILPRLGKREVTVAPVVAEPVVVAPVVAEPPEMVQIPGGTFMMGSPEGTGRSDEHPQHEVTVAAFSIGKYEVTQGQWRAVMGNNPSYSSSCGDNCPVDQVSWNDVQEYIKKLNAKTGKSYRLPSEAEWEYACRGGVAGEIYCGGNDLDAVAWYTGNAGNDSGSETHPVGGKAANGFGLFDMSGNVYEWTCSEYESTYSGKENTCAKQGNNARSLRGGSWVTVPIGVRAASRDDFAPSIRSSFGIGFRVVQD